MAPLMMDGFTAAWKIPFQPGTGNRALEHK
jgi:hypothetical protein